MIFFFFFFGGWYQEGVDAAVARTTVRVTSATTAIRITTDFIGAVGDAGLAHVVGEVTLRLNFPLSVFVLFGLLR